jgi:hypothetical protein
MLHISNELQLPLDAVTQTTSILGKRGVGKTHAATVIAEEMLENKLQVVIVDPVGVWWGLRSSASGKGPGYALPVLGGERGDLPLEAAGGPLLADFLVEKKASAVIDVSEFSKTDQRRFVAEFLERLYRKNRTPLHLVLDEADEFAPQRLNPGVQRCFGAVDTVVRRGRARGIGITLVTQRSAAINKDVLSQTECLIAFRTISPQDRAALEAWIEAHATEEQREQFLAAVSNLEVGRAWVWSPAWLDIFKPVRFRARRTFDSSKTPEVGAARASVKVAPVDLEALGVELKALVAKAEAEDPRRLQAALARERARRESVERTNETYAEQLAARAPAEQKVREVPVFRKGDLALLERVVKGLDGLTAVVRQLQNHVAKLESGPAAAGPINAPPPRDVAPIPKSQRRVDFVRVDLPRETPSASGGAPVEGGGRMDRAILATLATYGPSDKRRLTLLAGYRWSGGFKNALARLRGAGLIEGGNTGVMELTSAGRAQAPNTPPIPTDREARLQHWLQHGSFGAMDRAILEALARVHPKGMDSEQLLQATGYRWSGGFKNALARLRTAGVIDGRNTETMRAADALFT